MEVPEESSNIVINKLSDETMGNILSTSAENKAELTEKSDTDSEMIEKEGKSEVKDTTNISIEHSNLTDSLTPSEVKTQNPTNSKEEVEVEQFTKKLSAQDINLIIMGKPDNVDSPSNEKLTEELWQATKPETGIIKDDDEDFEDIVKDLETAIVATEKYDTNSPQIVTKNEETDNPYKSEAIKPTSVQEKCDSPKSSDIVDSCLNIETSSEPVKIIKNDENELKTNIKNTESDSEINKSSPKKVVETTPSSVSECDTDLGLICEKEIQKNEEKLITEDISSVAEAESIKTLPDESPSTSKQEDSHPLVEKVEIIIEEIIEETPQDIKSEVDIIPIVEEKEDVSPRPADTFSETNVEVTKKVIGNIILEETVQEIKESEEIAGESSEEDPYKPVEIQEPIEETPTKIEESVDLVQAQDIVVEQTAESIEEKSSDQNKTEENKLEKPASELTKKEIIKEIIPEEVLIKESSTTDFLIKEKMIETPKVVEKIEKDSHEVKQTIETSVDVDEIQIDTQQPLADKKVEESSEKEKFQKPEDKALEPIKAVDKEIPVSQSKVQNIEEVDKSALKVEEMLQNFEESMSSQKEEQQPSKPEIIETKPENPEIKHIPISEKVPIVVEESKPKKHPLEPEQAEKTNVSPPKKIKLVRSKPKLVRPQPIQKIVEKVEEKSKIIPETKPEPIKVQEITKVEQAEPPKKVGSIVESSQITEIDLKIESEPDVSNKSKQKLKLTRNYRVPKQIIKQGTIVKGSTMQETAIKTSNVDEKAVLPKVSSETKITQENVSAQPKRELSVVQNKDSEQFKVEKILIPQKQEETVLSTPKEEKTIPTSTENIEKQITVEATVQKIDSKITEQVPAEISVGKISPKPEVIAMTAETKSVSKETRVQLFKEVSKSEDIINDLPDQVQAEQSSKEDECTLKLEENISLVDEKMETTPVLETSEEKLSSSILIEEKIPEDPLQEVPSEKVEENVIQNQQITNKPLSTNKKEDVSNILEEKTSLQALEIEQSPKLDEQLTKIEKESTQKVIELQKKIVDVKVKIPEVEETVSQMEVSVSQIETPILQVEKSISQEKSPIPQEEQTITQEKKHVLQEKETDVKMKELISQKEASVFQEKEIDMKEPIPQVEKLVPQTNKPLPQEKQSLSQAEEVKQLGPQEKESILPKEKPVPTVEESVTKVVPVEDEKILSSQKESTEVKDEVLQLAKPDLQAIQPIQVKDVVPQIKEQALEEKETISQVQDTVLEVIETLPEVKETVPEVKETVPEVKETIPEVKETVPEVEETLLEVKETLPEIKETLLEVKETVPEVKETLPEVKETVPEVIETLPEVKETVPEVIETVSEVKETLSEVKETVPEVIETVSEVKETLPEVNETVPEVIETVSEVKETLPEVKETVPVVKEPVKEAKQTLPQVKEPVQKALETVSEPKESVPEVKKQEQNRTVKKSILQEKDKISKIEETISQVKETVPLMKEPVPQPEKRILQAEKPVPQAKKLVRQGKKPIPQVTESLSSADETVPELKEPEPLVAESIPQVQETVAQSKKPIVKKKILKMEKPQQKVEQPVPKVEVPISKVDKLTTEVEEPAPRRTLRNKKVPAKLAEAQISPKEAKQPKKEEKVTQVIEEPQEKIPETETNPKVEGRSLRSKRHIQEPLQVSCGSPSPKLDQIENQSSASPKVQEKSNLSPVTVTNPLHVDVNTDERPELKLTISKQRNSPKIRIKPIVKPQEEPTTSKAAENVPKLTIKPVVKPMEPLKITITKQSDETHSILKIFKPEEQQNPEIVPKLTIKSVPKPEELSDEETVPKLTIKSFPKSEESSSAEVVPKLTIKSVPKSEESSSAEVVPKLTIKSVPKPEESQAQHSPRRTTRNIKILSPGMTVKTVEPSPKETQQNYPKVIIKPVLKPDEKVSQLSPRQKIKALESSGITMEPVLPEKESQITPLKMCVKQIHKDESSTSKVSKPITKTCEIVHSEDGTASPLKLTIKPIMQTEQSHQSPKLTIKPVPKPEEITDDEKQERIVLKIPKNNIPSPKERVPRKETEIKQTESQSTESDKSEKLGKIKLKLTKEGSHAQIIPSQLVENPLKRTIISIGDSGILEKRSRTEDSDISINIVESSTKNIALTSLNNEVTIEKVEPSIPSSSSSSMLSKALTSPMQKEETSKLKDMLLQIQQKTEITCTQVEVVPEASQESNDSDDVKIIGIIPPEGPKQDSISINESSNSEDVVIISEITPEVPMEIEPTPEPETVVKPEPKPEPEPQPVVQGPPVPKKRGRPRKNPIEVKPEIIDEPVVVQDTTGPIEEDEDEVIEIRTSKRHSRTPGGREPYVPKAKKPRGGRTPRGRGRGAVNTRNVIDIEDEIGIHIITPPKQITPTKSPRGKGRKGKKYTPKKQQSPLIIDQITLDESNDAQELLANQAREILATPTKSQILSGASTPIDPPGTPFSTPMKEPESPKLTPLKLEGIKGAEPVQGFEEETRMSASENNSRAQTPARQFVVPPPSEGPEESQSSIQSTATTESNKNKKGRLEIIDLDSHVTTVEQIAEYYWNDQGPFMLQEQIAQYLGVKSFKRKYPGLSGRRLEMQERDFIREKGLVSESLCDMGLTAVPASEILDIMYTDFQEKYEEYRKFMRDKQSKEISNRQKAISLATTQEKNKLDFKERAMQDAANWNQNFNKTRQDSRSCFMDLQTYTINYPQGKIKVPQKSKVGNYPIALVPGQFTDYFKNYSPTELNYFPLNTVRFGPVFPNQHLLDEEKSESGNSDSDSSSGSDSDSSDSDSSSSEDETVPETKPINGTSNGTLGPSGTNSIILSSMANAMNENVQIKPLSINLGMSRVPSPKVTRVN